MSHLEMVIPAIGSRSNKILLREVLGSSEELRRVERLHFFFL